MTAADDATRPGPGRRIDPPTTGTTRGIDSPCFATCDGPVPSYRRDLRAD